MKWSIGVWRHVKTERSICANCGGGKPAQSAKAGQRDTMHNTLRYTITMWIMKNNALRYTITMYVCLLIKSTSALYKLLQLFIIKHSSCTIAIIVNLIVLVLQGTYPNKSQIPDTELDIISLGMDTVTASPEHRPVQQFTCCASTRDNWHNCVPTTRVWSVFSCLFERRQQHYTTKISIQHIKTALRDNYTDMENGKKLVYCYLTILHIHHICNKR